MKRPVASGKIRLSVGAKVLLVVLGVLIVLPLVMVWIVSRQTSELVQEQDHQALATAEVVFGKTLDIRERNLLARYRNIVGEPSFKAVVTQTQRDAATVVDYLRGLFDQPGETSESLLFYNTKDELFATAVRDTSSAIDSLGQGTSQLASNLCRIWSRSELDSFKQIAAPLVSAALEGEAGAATVNWQGRAFTVLAMPVSLGRTGPVVGVLVAGVSIGDLTLREWSILTGAEVVLVSGNSVLASTLPATVHNQSWLTQAAAARSGAHEVVPVIVGTEHYYALSMTGEPGAAPGGVRPILLASYERSVRALGDTRQSLLGVSLAGILLSMLVVWILVGRITKPLSELRDSAEAVGRGDFSRRIVRLSNDECGDLAVAFNGMTESLQTSHTELSKAVETLKSTQTQLIQSEKLSAVGQFVAGVAHELNNPLTTVVGFADLLSHTETNEKNRRHLELIVKSAQRCHKIVHSLLSFARQHAPEHRVVGVNGLIDEVMEIMAYDLRTSNITVKCQLAPGLPELLVDPHQLQQVFINILGNARQALDQFRREGEIVIRTRLAGPRVLIEFQDNGPGIRSENISRVFDPFFTTKPLGKGTGLGLSLSYGIIQEHGGKISVQSEAGHGALFIIELPVAAQTPAALTAPEHAARSGTPWPTAQGKSVLVVDDEDWILQLTEELLQREGYAVETATSGDRAVELMAAHKFDVVVSDWKMPGLTGMDLYEHLRKTDPAAAERMIFMSGDVINDTFQEFLSQRARTCLSKPFSVEDFRTAVARVLRKTAV